MHGTASSLLHSLPTFSVAPGLGRSRDFLHDWNRLYKLNGHGEDGEEEGPGAGAGGGGESTVTGMEEDMTTEDGGRLTRPVPPKIPASGAAYSLHLAGQPGRHRRAGGE